MICEKVYLDPQDDRVFLEVFAVNDSNVAPRDAMLLIPGGGYSELGREEGIYPALAFLGRGINTFILTYRVDKDAVYPTQLIEAALAIKHIKENAEKYHINPNRIFAAGFSAGGHLLGTLATLYGVAEKELDLPEDYLKIRGAIYGYPVITTDTPTNRGTFKNLLNKPLEEYTEDEARLLSIEKNINSSTPPAFIWHTSEDVIVPINGSLKLCQAYYDAGIPVELHVYPYGPHAITLATDYTLRGNESFIQPRAEVWVEEAFKWMKTLDN